MRRGTAMVVMAMWIGLAAAPARAGGTVSVSSMSVDGLELRDLSCQLDKAPLLGPLVVAGALASQKEALQACGPGGAAYRVRFVWASTTDAEVEAASDKGGPCVAGAMAKVPAAVPGTCTVVILTGPVERAEAARAKLPGAPAPAPAP